MSRAWRLRTDPFIGSPSFLWRLAWFVVAAVLALVFVERLRGGPGAGEQVAVVRAALSARVGG